MVRYGWRTAALGSVLALAFSAGACKKQRSYGPPAENVYRMVLQAKVTSLDPHITSDVYSSQSQALAYESLYQFHFLKKGELIPALAESLPKVSNGGKTWEIKLKPGVYYQDDPCFKSNGGKGREVMAADVEYYFRRIADKKYGSPAYSGLDTLIKGIEDFRQGKASSISGVTVMDKYTARIDLLKRSPRFIYGFASVHGAMIPEECVKYYGDDISNHAIGTGPFKIVKYSPVKVEAVRNPSYRQEFYPSGGMPGDKEKGLLVDAGKQIPFVDKVILEVIEEDQPAWLRFLSGDFEQSRVPKDSLGATFVNGKPNEEIAKKGIQHFRAPMSDVVVHFFNLEDPVWGKNKDLRRAFAYARDNAAFIEKIYVGQAITAHTIMSPFEWGYDQHYRSPLQEHNIGKAKELLAKAGYPGGQGLPEIVYPSNVGATYRQINELLERSLSEAGIKLKAEPMAWPDFSKRLKEGKYTAIGMGWVGDMPDAETSLPMFHSRAVPPEGQNYPRYRNKAYDRLIEDIETEDNTPGRYAKIRKAAKMLEDDLVILPVAHRVGNQLYHSWVGNATFVDELFKVPFMKYRRVNTSAAR